MNPRQRRGVLLLALAVIGACGVFVSIVNYVGDVQAQVGPMVPVLRLATDARPYEPVTDGMVERVQLPARWSPANGLTDALQLAGRVPTAQLPAGTVLQEGMLVDPPELGQGQREMAILVDAETGVAGRIGRGSVVDILATFQGSDQQPSQATVVVENAEILAVGAERTTAEEDPLGGFAEGQVVPVTFALEFRETLRVAYAEANASTVRLALRAPDDTASLSETQRSYQPGAAVDAPPSEPGG